MASFVSSRLLRRGLEIFAAISALGFLGLLLYGNNFPSFVNAMGSLQWRWVAGGVALASLDWLGGGLRPWVLVRHVFPRASLKGCVVAGGPAPWAGYLTPSQARRWPAMISAMKPSGMPIPAAGLATLM